MLREACRWATFIGVRARAARSRSTSRRASSTIPKLAHTVARARCKETGLPPRLLELEITETLAMQHTDVTLATLKRLKALGVSIAIDDFGTGYSSLAYLKRFPVDKLKIDRSVRRRRCPHDREQARSSPRSSRSRTRSTLEVIAEGVETEAQREFLSSCGCDYIQGYLIGAPLDADAAAKDFV